MTVGGARRGDECGGYALHAALGSLLAGAETALVGRWPEGVFEPTLALLRSRCDTSRLEVVAGEPGRLACEYDAELSRLAERSIAGMETLVTADDIPESWFRSRTLLLPSLGHPSSRLAFLRKVRANMEIPLVGVLVEPGDFARDRVSTLAALRECDVAFLSLEDACRFADGEDVWTWVAANVRQACIGMGPVGAMLVSGGPVRLERAATGTVADPTAQLGSLAGAVLGSLAQGRPIEKALRYGVEAARLDAAEAGLRSLLGAPRLELSETPREARARMAVPDFDRIHAVARALEGGSFEPFRFVTPAPYYPPVGHPRAAEYFFTVVLHQYGFWNLDGDRWSGSMTGVVDGVELKGSDFVWRSATKALLEGKPVLTDFLDDDGRCPLPMAESHRELAAGFQAFLEKNPPEAVLAACNAAQDPLEHLLGLLDEAPGYREDPYQKKAMLLGMTLAHRPERFLRAADGGVPEGWGPVVDYHIQRTSLRSGMVVPLDEELRAQLNGRRLLTEEQEDAVRRATYDAMMELSRLSGLSHPAIDLLFFQARKRCPEASEPQCPECPLEAACARQKKLFQPVYRTTAY